MSGSLPLRLQAISMLPFRMMYPHIGSLIGLFRLCGYCSAPPIPMPVGACSAACMHVQAISSRFSEACPYPHWFLQRLAVS